MNDEKKLISVGCNIGNGVKLRVYDFVDSLETPGTKMPRELGVIDLPGPVAGHGERPGQPPESTVTPVDADLFDKWWLQNEHSDLVLGGAIYKLHLEKDHAQPEAEHNIKADERELPPKEDPKPTDAHDDIYRDNFKDHAGQEEPRLRGKGKDEVDGRATEHGE